MERTNQNVKHFSRARLLTGTALAVLATTGAALAQGNAALTNETVVVTGTNIRGAAPVGANVITMDTSQIEATGAVTTQDLLTNIPSLSGFGNQGGGADGRGGLGTADASGSSSPNIHSLGASSSSTTLILVDGHHVPLSGLSHTLVDPSIIAPDAIARVDVLPDGASAVYGSDASAGVINIITKKKYTGLEFSLQGGIADSYNRTAAGVSFGHAWNDGAAMVAYDYSSSSRLLVADRPYLANNLVSRGGFNGASFNCSPATIAGNGTTGTTGTANVYVYPYTSPAIGSTSVAVGAISSAPCDQRYNNNTSLALLPSEVRHNVFASFNQQFGDRIAASFDLGFSDHVITTPVSRGTLTAIAFGPGSANTQPLVVAGQAAAGAQTNPFYQAGSSGLTSSEGIRYDFNSLLGPGAYTKGGQLDVFVAGGIDVNLFGDWVATLSGTAGVDWSSSKSRGTVNATAANMALNGTANVNGTAVTGTSSSAQADSFGLGETINVTRVPLTTANALDVWNPVGSNKTSAAVLAQLVDSPQASDTQQDLNDLQLEATGTLFTLPAGAIKTVFGIDYLMNNFVTAGIGPNANNTLFASVNANATNFKANRTDWAEFIEFRIPLISADAGIPLVQEFDLDVAGRHDHYSTFGATDNPKASFSWVVTDGIKATGRYGTSFVAPTLTALPVGFGAGVAVNANGANQTVLASHVNAPGSWCASGCTLDTAHPGLTITGANNSNPMTALTYTFGLELHPGQFMNALNGLNIQVTYWQNKSKGLITTPTLANEAQVPGLQSQLLLAPPGGWTPTSPALQAAIAGIPLNGVIQPTVWYIYHNVQQNAFNILANGIDFDINYTLPTDTAGDFNIDLSGADKLRFDETPYPTGASTRFLNGYNVNTTFSSLALTGRLTLGWHFDPVTVSLAVNYVNPYFFQTSNAPFNVATPGVPAGFQHIHASYPLDVHVSYNLPNDWVEGTTLSLTVNNILDQKPPFYDSGLGYDPDNASPLGRIAQLAIRKKF